MKTKLLIVRAKLFVYLMVFVAFNTLATAAESAGRTTYSLPALLENQEMLILNVELAPSQTSAPHRHNAHVFVTVLEGTIEMQVRGGPLTRLGPGEMFHETPEDIHQVSRNASDTESAKFLVHILKAVGKPVTVPAD